MGAPAPAHYGEGGWNASGAPGRRTGEMERMRAMVRLLMAGIMSHQPLRASAGATTIRVA
jgi:hypothetical protein